ncbi:MAG: DUF47 family protein [Clostridia bacterium]|nr:DUF47 family protein [Clostridia bacterium]
MKKKAKKNFDYFESLVKMSEFALEEAKYLKEVLATYDPETLEEKKTHMHELEHRCDMEKHDLTTALVKDFLPPIEREDLFNLAHMTDNLTDCVENVMVFLYMADIQKMREDVPQFVDLIIECCVGVSEVLREFPNFKKSEKLASLIVALNDLEEQGDKLYMDAVRNLSKMAKTTREVIEWRDIYKIFENCFDAAESIADNVESAVMKNS